MYSKSARYYDSIYAMKDYRAEALRLKKTIRRHHPGAGSLLDVACGTGRYLAELRADFDVEGLDINPEFLATARARLPGVPLHEGDMTGFNLGRSFDVVACLFSSIVYVKTVENLRRAISAMADHVAPDGLLLIEPFVTPEKYWEDRVILNVSDTPNLKIVWMYVMKRQGAMAIFDINYLIGTPSGIEHFTEAHELGLFTHEDYAGAFKACGFGFDHDPEGLFGRGLYTARR
jgi:SAM-dependent methyltransferase